MNEATVKLVLAAGIFIPVFAAWWVWRDANRLKKDGSDVSPMTWAALTILMWPMGLAVYFLLCRKRSRSNPPRDTVVSPDRIVWGVAAFFLAVALSMVATWLLVTRFPVPDDDAIVLGLVGFFFVMVVDLCLVFFLIRPKLGGDERMEAAKLSAGIILVGLLVASFVGVLPWSFRWLLDHNPWISSSFRALFPWLVIAEIAWLWRLRRARRST